MNSLRQRIHHFIFESDTPSAKGFDITLIIVILVSVASVILESIPSFNARFGGPLHQTEWIITIIFTMEYIARIWSHPKPLKYIFSFYGIIDFLAIIPTYLDLIFAGAMTPGSYTWTPPAPYIQNIKDHPVLQGGKNYC